MQPNTRSHAVSVSMLLRVGRWVHQDEGKGDDDVVIFTGSGSTGAVAKIVSALGLDKKLRRSWGRRTKCVWRRGGIDDTNWMPLFFKRRCIAGPLVQ